jgi:hypothetical protein
MPNTQGSLHHAVLLSQYAQDWRPPQEGYYMAPELFPLVPVSKEFDDYMRINSSTWRQRSKSMVSAQGDVSTVDFFRDTDGSYKAKPYALRGIIDLKERAAADDVLGYEKLKTDVPLYTLHNDLEVDAFAVALNTANLGTSYENVAAGDMFDNVFNANPVLYIERKCAKIKRTTGFKVTDVVIDDLVWRAIKWHPTTQQFLPVHTTPAALQLLSPKWLEEKLAEVMEPGAIKITSMRLENGRAPVALGSSDLRSVIGPNMIIAYNAKGTSRADWSGFKCFSWTGGEDPETGAKLEGGDPMAPIGVYTFPMPWQGQRGSVAVQVITNRAYVVGRTESIFVAFGCVDSSNTSLYSTELQ